MPRNTEKGIHSTNPVNKLDCSKLNYRHQRKEKRRLKTFRNWPAGASADPNALAREGFFYTGSEDRVQCEFCHGRLSEWQPTDIPSVEHKKYFPDCPFVCGLDVDVDDVSMTGQKPVSDHSRKTNIVEGQPLVLTLRTECSRPAIIKHMTTMAVQHRVDSRKIKARMVSAKVRQILDMGYSSSLVRGIIAERLATTGDDYPTTESLLEAIFRLEETNAAASASGLATIPAVSDDASRISLIRSTSPLPTSGALYSASSTTSPRSTNPHNGQNHVDDSDTLHVISRPFAFASSSMSTFKSLAEQPSASATVSVATREETIADSESKAKGKRKRNKKKAAGALKAETIEEDEQNLMSEAATGPQTELENLAQLEELNLNENQNKDYVLPDYDLLEAAEMLSFLEELVGFQTTNPTASTSGLTASSAASDGASKRKRSMKKKTKKTKENKVVGVFNATTIDEDEKVAESAAGPQNDLEIRAQLEEMNINENQNEEIRRYVEENRRLREARSCKVCMDAEVNTVFRPCGHLVCCNSCAPLLRNCPICRKFIRGTVKTFLP